MTRAASTSLANACRSLAGSDATSARISTGANRALIASSCFWSGGAWSAASRTVPARATPSNAADNHEGHKGSE